MSELRSTLAQYSRWTRIDLGSRVGLPAVPLISQVAAAMRNREVRGYTLTADRRAQLDRTIRSAAADKQLGRVSNRDWRRAPDVFWYSDSEPLIEIPGVLAKFIEWFRASQHSGSAQSLISAYIQAFDGSSRTIETIGSELRRFLTATQSVRFIKWRERQQEYHLFEPALAPGAIAKRVLGSDNPIGAIYHEIGIDGENTWSNIGRRSLAAAFQAVEIAFRNNDVNAIGFLQRLRAWLELKGPLKSLALETKYYLARTLVTPWENGNPPPALLDPLKEFIHDLLGDPRSSDFAWREGRLDAVRPIVLRWYIAETMEAFFRIIDQSADPWHWTDRKAFWGAYHRAGHISDAWVAFGPKVLPTARRLRDEDATQSLRFAELRNTTDRLHSILFLRIRGLIVADYSHSGSCRFYLEDNRNRPQFYEPVYSEPLVRACASEAMAHQVNWQRRFASFIYQATGAKPPAGTI